LKIQHAAFGQKGQGRYEYQDRLRVIPRFGKNKQEVWGAVLDGHFGNALTAEEGAEHLHRFFNQARKKGQTSEQAMVSAYHAVDERCRTFESGACAATFLLERASGKLTFANAGDVRILLITPEDVQQLTIDHRTSNRKERERFLRGPGRIEGVYFSYGNFDIMVSRSLGDFKLKPAGLIATPQTGTCLIPQGTSWLVSATDGLFDDLLNNHVAEIVRKLEQPSVIIPELITIAVDRLRSDDDITIVVLRITR